MPLLAHRACNYAAFATAPRYPTLVCHWVRKMSLPGLPRRETWATSAAMVLGAEQRGAVAERAAMQSPGRCEGKGAERCQAFPGRAAQLLRTPSPSSP